MDDNCVSVRLYSIYRRQSRQTPTLSVVYASSDSPVNNERSLDKADNNTYVACISRATRPSAKVAARDESHTLID